MRSIVYPDQSSGLGEEIKMIIYSAHDYTVAQHLLLLNASNADLTKLPFAASLVYELHSSSNCQN
jgi:hypothetical protein